MAAIDKTYIDGKEYLTYRQWWINNYDKMVKDLGKAIWLYTFTIFDKWDLNITPDYLKDNTEDINLYTVMYDFPIWNTSEQTDKWLIKHCDITSFRKRMLHVYKHNWSGFKGQKWAQKQP